MFMTNVELSLVALRSSARCERCIGAAVARLMSMRRFLFSVFTLISCTAVADRPLRAQVPARDQDVRITVLGCIRPSEPRAPAAGVTQSVEDQTKFILTDITLSADPARPSVTDPKS